MKIATYFLDILSCRRVDGASKGKGEGKSVCTQRQAGGVRLGMMISICQIKVFIASLFNIPCSFIILSQNIKLTTAT